ncbi:MAG: polysaccharide pyruvyl transferase family protein [Planctomycetota bacterium]
MSTPGPGQRTGILTLHYGFNEGAILQAYALAMLLRSVFAGQVEIVDQRYPAKMAAYGDPDANDRTRSLAKAIDGWLPLGSEPHRTSESGKLIQALGTQYDRLVFGSDVLWSLRYRRRLSGVLGKGILPRQKHRFFPAFPNIYWPSAEQDCCKIAFAASVGSFDWQQLPKKHASMIRSGLESCSALSVRDERSRDFVAQLSPSLAARVQLIADPTFAGAFRDSALGHEADGSLREELAAEGVDFNRPRCLVIAKDGPALAASLRPLAQKGWQSVSVTTANDLCDLHLHDHGFHPLTWARLFRHFDLCITERMHGAIFSLLNNTPFLAIEMNPVRDGGMTKTESLLHRFELEGVLLEPDEGDSKAVEALLERVIHDPWDWQRINQRIAAESERQRIFLQDSMKVP